MKRKVTIIGAGNVGSTIAYTLAISGDVNEILLIDINEEKAAGEAMDIDQGTAFCDPVIVRSGTYADAENSDIVVITSGMARKPGQSRLDLAQANVNILKDITPQIVKHAPDAVYIIVSNPVDVLTYVFCKISGLPENRILGTGTILDTARLRSYIAEHFSVNKANVHSYVFGEHGDSMFIPWSVARISSIDLVNYNDTYLKEKEKTPLEFDEVAEYIRTSGAKVIERKGSTFYAVAIAAAHICKCIVSGTDTVLLVSSMLRGEFGIDDVCLSVLTVIGKEGVKGRLETNINDQERKLLKKCAASLKEVISQLNI
jgi:L-lactate dehydrogenase